MRSEDRKWPSSGISPPNRQWPSARAWANRNFRLKPTSVRRRLRPSRTRRPAPDGLWRGAGSTGGRRLPRSRGGWGGGARPLSPPPRGGGGGWGGGGRRAPTALSALKSSSLAPELRRRLGSASTPPPHGTEPRHG